MKKVKMTGNQLSMIAKAVRYMISNLQFERHQALAHSCAGGSYDKEIEEYKQLKEFIENVRTAED